MRFLGFKFSYSKTLKIRPSISLKKVGLNREVVSLSNYQVEMESKTRKLESKYMIHKVTIILRWSLSEGLLYIET